MKTTLIAAIAVAASISVAAVIYLAKPIEAEKDSSAVQGVRAMSDSSSQAQVATVQNACIGAARPDLSRGTLGERYRWAETLMDQKLFDAALPDLRDIAAADPGFPGINLEIARSLAGLNRPAEAKQAVDTQMEISDCLSKLSPEEVRAYCRAEVAASDPGACRQELARIQQAAVVQSAAVDAEVRPDAAITSSVRGSSSGRVLIAAAKTNPVPRRATHALSAKDSPDKSLMNGDGTDSALGAYSKP